MNAAPVDRSMAFSSMSRTSSLQRMLDLENKYKLQRLQNNETPIAQAQAPGASIQARPPLLVRRADSLSQQNQLMLNALRRGATLPSLSITIPAPKGQSGAKVDHRQAAEPSPRQAKSDLPDPRDMELYDSEPEDDELELELDKENGETMRRTVKFIGADGEEMSDAESSICQSPSWEGYGRQKQKKKEEASKRKKEKEQAEKDIKAAKKRLAARLSKNPPPTSISRPSSRTANPMPVTERSLSAPILAKHSVAERGSRPNSRQTNDGNASAASSTFNVARLFGGRRSDIDKQAFVKKPVEMVTYVPLSYAVMGQVALAPTSASRKRQSVDSFASSWSGRYEDIKPSRDQSHPPSASRSHTLLIGAGPDRKRSSSLTGGLLGRGATRSSSNSRETRSNKDTKSGSSSSASSDSAPSTPVANERGRSLPRGYVQQVREQSSDRAFSGFMDEQLVNMVNGVPAPKNSSFSAEPLTALKSKLKTKTADPNPNKALSTARDVVREPEKRHRKSGKSRADSGRKRSERAVEERKEREPQPVEREVQGQTEKAAEEDQDEIDNDYFGLLRKPYIPPALDLVSPVTVVRAGGTLVDGAADDEAVSEDDVKGASRDTNSMVPRPNSRSAKSAAGQNKNTANEKLISAMREQFVPTGPEKMAKRGSSQGHLNTAGRGESPVTVGKAESREKNPASQDPATLRSVSQKAASAVELARPSSQMDWLPSPSAPGFKSTTALHGKRKPDVAIKRASSALGISSQDDFVHIPSKAARVLGEFGNCAAQRPPATNVNAKPVEGSSSSSSYDDLSSLPSPVTTPDTSRPQSQRGHSAAMSETPRAGNDATAVSEDEEDDDGVILLQDQPPTSSSLAQGHAYPRPASATAKMRSRSPVDDSWSRTALPVDMDAQSITGSVAYDDGALSKSDLIGVEIPLPSSEPLGREDEYDGPGKTLLETQPHSAVREAYANPMLSERSLSPSLRRHAMSPQVPKNRGAPYLRQQLAATDSADSGKSSSSSETGKPGPSKLRTALVSSSSSSVSFDSSSASNSSAAYLQEARKSAPTSSRNSSSSRPPHTGAPTSMTRPSLINGPKPHSSPGPSAKLTGAGLLPEQQRPIAKMFVECCQCHFYHDLPSRLYEFMASPESIVEDKLLGVSGAITTSVKCPWCAHNMSTKCCSGYAAVVYLKEKLH